MFGYLPNSLQRNPPRKPEPPNTATLQLASEERPPRPASPLRLLVKVGEYIGMAPWDPKAGSLANVRTATTEGTFAVIDCVLNADRVALVAVLR